MHAPGGLVQPGGALLASSLWDGPDSGPLGPAVAAAAAADGDIWVHTARIASVQRNVANTLINQRKNSGRRNMRLPPKLFKVKRNIKKIDQ